MAYIKDVMTFFKVFFNLPGLLIVYLKIFRSILCKVFVTLTCFNLSINHFCKRNIKQICFKGSSRVEIMGLSRLFPKVDPSVSFFAETMHGKTDTRKKLKKD